MVGVMVIIEVSRGCKLRDIEHSNKQSGQDHARASKACGPSSVGVRVRVARLGLGHAARVVLLYLDGPAAH